MATGAGVVALSCPSCGAPLELREVGTVHACRYCNTSCIVPHQSVLRAMHRTPEPSIFWLLFQGLSPTRTGLLAPPPAAETVTGEAAKKALRMLKIGRAQPVGDAPGVYEAPERKGFNGLQWLVTLTLAGIALAIGLGVALIATGVAP